jgi:hypothetical protein
MHVSQGFFAEIFLCSLRVVQVPEHKDFDFSQVSRSLFETYSSSRRDGCVISLHPCVKNYHLSTPRLIRPSVIKVDEIEQPIRGLDLFQGFKHDCCISLAHIVDLIEVEEKSDPGVLLTNGLANFMFVRTVDGTVLLVNLVYTKSDWCIGCRPLTDDYVCFEGRRLMYQM